MPYLRCNHSTRTPTAQLALYVDSTSERTASISRTTVHRLRWWAACHWVCRRGEHRDGGRADGGDPTAWWDYLDSTLDKDRPVWVWCYDLARTMTLLDLWGRLDEGRYQLTRLVSADPPSIVTIQCGLGRAHILDTRNYWRCPLTDMPGAPSREDMLRLAEGTLREVVSQRCGVWAGVIRGNVQSLCELIRGYDLGVFCKTAPALALSTFRHRHLSVPILSHEHVIAGRLEEAALVGGQVICGYIGKVQGPIYHLDVSALYPHCMDSNPYPVELVRQSRALTVDDLRDLTEHYGVIASVRIHSDYDTYPVRIGKRTTHATGDYWTTLCGPELCRALAASQVTEVGRVAWYLMHPIFHSFVREWWGRRLQYEAAGMPVYAHLCKVILNSLHGKFSQKKRAWLDAPGVPVVTDWGRWCNLDTATGTLIQYRAVAGHVQRLVEGGWARDAVPAIACFVHSYARAHMHRLRSLLPERTLYYQDTDSLHLTERGYRTLADMGMIEQRTLGSLRLVQMAQRGEYRGVRDYRLDGRDSVAGLPAQAVAREDGAYIFTESHRLDSIVSHDPTHVLTETEVVRRWRRDYAEGVVMHDGWVVPTHYRIDD